MTVEILWVKNKLEGVLDYSRQTKTFESEEKALEWCRRNSAHILQINNSRWFYSDNISHFDITDALESK